MAPYTEEADQAWIDGAPAPIPATAEPSRPAHPQVRALEHAAEQLRAARHWSHTDPAVHSAYREAIDALAAELHHHTENDTDPNTTTKENTTMAGETTITVIGNLANDPELRFTPSGSAVANFTVASTPRTFDRQTNQWVDGETLFLRASIWREAAENVAETLAKGMRVIVTGRLKSRSYETKEGEKRTVIELEVEEIGPSLRWSSAKVQRNQRAGQGPTQNTGPGQNEDPWAHGGAGQQQGWGSGAETEPPF
ncbi:single-stranded DNA-binding protein [Sinomonas sp. JGH33]|uniref:Single-stranded DNA-binding protein n=1 Tax=Sinomonas terricola TaxID=3110330 RepID=A0ABU5TCX0_9MICC|nr:single-stranded DNA-binding protein [Sinomonas sp. JGH33]MEA5456921.1 single-stranded DNA-binding protein [Sinomonas sp. JGH33]